jgi:putative ABC transport system permease protein
MATAVSITAMMNKMIVANLVQRPIRSLISIVAIGLEVTLILMIVWLSLGMMNDTRTRQEGIGYDVIVLPPGSSNIIGMTGAPAPIKIADILAKLEHVKTVSPVLMQISSGTGGAPEVLYGIDLKSYESLGGPFRYVHGGPYQGPDDVLVDDIFAQSKHVKVGDSLQILNHSFKVSGIVEHGKGARKFLPLATLQDLIGAQGKASAFFLKLDNAGAANEVVTEVKSTPGMQQYVVYSVRDYLSTMTTSSIPALAIFINVVIGIAIVIGILVIFQAMYTAVMERTREIGILKSIGASKFYIVNVILRETALLAVAGIIVGIGFSLAASGIIAYKLPTLPLTPVWGWVINAGGIAMVSAIAGALYPAFKAAQKDPIDALAYE